MSKSIWVRVDQYLIEAIKLIKKVHTNYKHKDKAILWAQIKKGCGYEKKKIKKKTEILKI